MSIVDQIVNLSDQQQGCATPTACAEPADNASARGDVFKDRLWALRNGLEKLDTAAESTSVVRYFVELAKKQDARFLLLRRVNDDLRILLAHAVNLPIKYLDREAGRPALVAGRSDDVFASAGEERVVYVGRPPARAFPEDLSALIGGDPARSILIIPLPLKSKWNTYIYLDWSADEAPDKAAEAACLARYALLRLICLDTGNLPLGRVTLNLGESAPQRPDPLEAHESEDLKPGDLPAKVVISEAGELMALPQVALHILNLLRDPGTTAGLLEKAIVKDQVLTGQLLRIANSSFYEGYGQARTIRDAIVRLGFKNVRNWTLVTASRTAFGDIETRQSLYRIWRQSMMSAMGCQVVSDYREYHDRELVFVGGLMQNIGSLVLARARPEVYDRLLEIAADRQQKIWQVEQAVLGYDHGELGARVISEWNLGRDLENAVRYHHRLNEDQGQGTMSAMISLGEELGASLDLDPQNLRAQFITSVAAARLELCWENYCEMMEILKAQDLEVGL